MPFYLWDKKKEKKTKLAIMPHSPGCPSLTLSRCLFSSSTSSSIHQWEEEKKQLTNSRKTKMSMRIPTFSTRAFLCLSSCHQPMPAFVPLSLSVGHSAESFCLFPYAPRAHPVVDISTGLCFISCSESYIRLYMHLLSLIIMFCVLFSVPKLFVPFSVSVSLFAGTVC